VFNAVVVSVLPKRTFTQEEYAALEEKAEYKSQYVAGEIFAMAGVQPWHAEIVQNLSGMFYVRFRGGPCRAYVADMKVRVQAGDLWTYPDLSVLCDQPRFDTSANPHSLLNPQVIFEVLSPSTEGFDRGDKFLRYQRLESLTDYVLVASERVQVEHFARQHDCSWLYRRHEAPADLLKLSSVGVELPLAEIYERVAFPPPGAGG
jgi:Uma2 family endonuclease